MAVVFVHRYKTGDYDKSKCGCCCEIDGKDFRHSTAFWLLKMGGFVE